MKTSKIWKTRLLKLLIEEFSIKESSGSQFFRTTTGIQSGVTEILCSFKLVLEGKTGEERLYLINFVFCQALFFSINIVVGKT